MSNGPGGPTFVARFSDGQSDGSRDVNVRLTDRGISIERPGEERLVWPFGALAVAEPKRPSAPPRPQRPGETDS